MFLEDVGREHTGVVLGIFWELFSGRILAFELQWRIKILEEFQSMKLLLMGSTICNFLGLCRGLSLGTCGSLRDDLKNCILLEEIRETLEGIISAFGSDWWIFSSELQAGHISQHLEEDMVFGGRILEVKTRSNHF